MGIEYPSHLPNQCPRLVHRCHFDLFQVLSPTCRNIIIFLLIGIGKGYDKVSLRKNYPGPEDDRPGHWGAQCNTIVNTIDMF